MAGFGLGHCLELVDFISVDVGWTKQNLILPNVSQSIKSGGICISLLKPHYELNKSLGEDLSGEFITEFVHSFDETFKANEFNLKGFVKSPIKGLRGGNTEVLLFLVKS